MNIISSKPQLSYLRKHTKCCRDWRTFTQTDNDDIIIFGRSSPLLDLHAIAASAACIDQWVLPLVAQTLCTVLLYDVWAHETHWLWCACCTAWNSKGLYSILIEGAGLTSLIQHKAYVTSYFVPSQQQLLQK